MVDKSDLKTRKPRGGRALSMQDAMNYQRSTTRPGAIARTPEDMTTAAQVTSAVLGVNPREADSIRGENKRMGTKKKLRYAKGGPVKCRVY